MQEHSFSFDIDASREELWKLFWNKRTGQVTEHGAVRIEILHAGDESPDTGSRRRGAEKQAMRFYAALDRDAGDCIGCAAPCATACPTGVDIPGKMRGAHERLALG